MCSQHGSQSTATIILNSEILKDFPFKIRSKTRMPTLFNIVLEALVISISQEKEIKGIRLGKEKVNTTHYICGWLDVENPKDSTKKLLQLINKWSKVAVYKNQYTKSCFAFYAINNLLETEITKTISFIITSKRKKYLGVNLTKEVKDLYTENYTILKKEMEVRNKWKDVLCSWRGRINNVEISILRKAMYRCNAISIKIIMTFFTEIEQTILQLLWKHKRLRKSKQPKEQSWRYHAPWYKTVLQSCSKQHGSQNHHFKNILEMK